MDAGVEEHASDAGLCGPQGCTPDNGTGVYYAEDGFAGIGSLKLLITHFMNNSNGTVAFGGRYLHPTKQNWLLTTGTVGVALYKQAHWSVMAVKEFGTMPTWRLRNPRQPVAPPIDVTDGDLQNLSLRLEFAIPGVGAESEPMKLQYWLAFDSPTDDTFHNNKVYSYNLRWWDTSAKPGDPPQQLPTQYCFKPIQPGDKASKLTNDPVVFQQGIDVDPVTGKVDRTSGDMLVTMSCRGGAPATVYSWGYSYQGNQAETFHFDAGIHMKRASYCADWKYYTVAGTQIKIYDDKSVNATISDKDALEAWWTREGATCLGDQRHPELVFDRKCPPQGSLPGRTLGPCPALPVMPLQPQSPLVPFLIDAPLIN